MNILELPTPALLVERQAMDANLRQMQDDCDSSGVELWPHVKTHKMVPALRRQLEMGAIGATCSKIGEAEALLPSGVRRIFIAHSLVDPAAAPRIKALQESLDELIIAVTSPAQCVALGNVLQAVGQRVPVLLAVDTGLHREGVRNSDDASLAASRINDSPYMRLIGLYSHEGQAYRIDAPEALSDLTGAVHETLMKINHTLGGNLPLWPGCSVTASAMTRMANVKAVRPGTYIFGDLSLTDTTGILPFDRAALTIYSTVVDLPAPGLALIDAGSKVFSGDKTPAAISGRCQELPSLVVSRVSEEHGYVTGDGVDNLKIGQRLRFVPAHVCPVVNLADCVRLIDGEMVEETWKVDARGRSD